jgi:ubiquinone/menaquinone biosynthesis C-methylase UbiE
MHGANATEQARLLRRDARLSAGFLLPHLRPGWQVLDCGCGVGSITCDLATFVERGYVVGLDSQPGQIERARALASERGMVNVRFDVGSAYDLPYADHSFDAAFANTLLQHLAEPRRALAEIKRVLKPGGVLGIADDDHSTLIWEPRTPPLTAAHQLICRVIQHRGGDLYRARHHRRLLQETGFLRTVATGTLGTGGVWGCAEETRQLAAWLADQLRAPATSQLALAEGWTDAGTLEEMISAVVTWGEQPEAFFGVLGVAAVGWLKDE